MAGEAPTPDDDALLAEVLDLARHFPEALPFSELPGLLALESAPGDGQPERSAPTTQASTGVPVSPSGVRRPGTAARRCGPRRRPAPRPAVDAEGG